MQSDLTTNEKIHLCIENKLSNQINLFINSNLHAKLPKINRELWMHFYFLIRGRTEGFEKRLEKQENSTDGEFYESVLKFSGNT